MIPGYLRKLYSASLNPFMWLNGRMYKVFRCPSSGLKVHLGPGHDRYINNWLNVDMNCVTAKIDLWANMTHGLPFKNSSVSAFYTFHVLEHLPYDVLPYVLKEVKRSLAAGGAVRIGVPDSGNAARAYVSGDIEWFNAFAKNFPRAHNSIGGKFANYVLCVNEHMQMLDRTFLHELLQNAGFENIVETKAFETSRPDLFDKNVLDKEYESTPDLPHTLVMEAN